jgi:hypothetical protein
MPKTQRILRVGLRSLVVSINHSPKIASRKKVRAEAKVRSKQ